jgi:hypothetical protein
VLGVVSMPVSLVGLGCSVLLRALRTKRASFVAVLAVAGLFIAVAGLFIAVEDLEDARFARCTALQRCPELVRSTTRFYWWPKRIAKRRGPRRN